QPDGGEFSDPAARGSGRLHLRSHHPGVRRHAGVRDADPGHGPVAHRGLRPGIADQPVRGQEQADAGAAGRARESAGGPEMSDAAANHEPGVSDTPEYREQLLGGPQRLALLVGGGGWVAFLILASLYYTLSPADKPEQEADRFKGICLPYLTGFVFWTMVALGSVFFLCVQYVTGGRWGMLLRRPLEANAKTLWLS